MKVILFGLVCFSLIFSNPQLVHAQETATSTEIQYTNEFSVQNEPSTIITLIKDFVSGFESILGGFVFYTPDPLGQTIELKDHTQIPGVTKYRNIFHQISIPLLAIIISFLAITKIGSDNHKDLQSFATKLVLVIALYITLPTILSYSIQFNNLLVNQISIAQEFTGFINQYFDESQQAISQNQNSEKFGIPSFDISLAGGIFRSLGKFIVQIFLFAITFLFLLGGFLFIGFQFAIRFATLLFLGVIYPIVIPFALWDRTQSILESYLKTWFSLLVQQPAFVLGFAIANDIFQSILNLQGPSIGLLFFYTGFLFFLGSVNILVAKIFSDSWSAISTNSLAFVSSRAISSPVNSKLLNFKKGLLGNSLAYSLGSQFKNSFRPTTKTNSTNDLPNFTPSFTPNQNNDISKPRTTSLPPLSRELISRGYKVEAENIKQGAVSISGNTYKYQDGKSGLTTYYPTISDAIDDGIPEHKLQRTELNRSSFIDLSAFNQINPNPHSYNALQQAQKLGKPVDSAYVTQASPQNKVKNFLVLAQERNQSMGIDGVIVERQAKNGTRNIIRLYSHRNYEKHQNL